MKIFWEGYADDGKKLTGEMDTYSYQLAQYSLQRQGITLIRLKRVYFFNLFKINFFTKKISRATIILFFRKLATLSQAGIPLVQSLQLLATAETLLPFQQMILTIKNQVAAGKSFSLALQPFNLYFDTFTCNLILLGEETGTFDKILLQLVTQMEKAQQFKNKLKQALFYPCFVLIIAFAVILTMLLWIVPRFAELFQNLKGNLPTATHAIFYLSYFLRKFGWILIGVLISFGLACYFFFKNKKYNYQTQELMLQLPFFGALYQKIMLARFGQYLGLALKAGLPLVHSLQLIAKNLGNSCYEKQLIDIQQQVNSGNALHQALSKSSLFPAPIPQLVQVGEETGMIEAILLKISELYEEEIAQILHRLTQLLEPLLITILGVLIGGLVIALYLPIFKLGTVI